MSEVTWIVDRVKLYDLTQKHLNRKVNQLAEEVGRSESWVRKWLQRFETGEPEDPHLFCSRSRARQTAGKRVCPEVEEAILSIRDEPPENLRRTPGPEAILYYLHRRDDLKAAGYYLPRSSNTIWRILDKHQRIYRPPPPQKAPEPLSEPMEDWQIDFKTVSSVPPEEGGKQQHVVETLNVVDCGTSILVSATPRADYHAQTVFIPILDTFQTHGLPHTMKFDRDPRLVGAWTAKEFPSAFMRFLHVLGIHPLVCPPKKPQKNAFVERYNGNYDRECLAIDRPDTLPSTITCTQRYYLHYNYERPHQGRTCQNQPPRTVFPDAQTERRLPPTVDPDAWLFPASRRVYKRRVNANGSIQIGNHRYYISQGLAKQRLLVRVLPQEKALAVYDDKECVKQVPIKGLYHGQMNLDEYVAAIMEEALAESRRLAVKRRQKQRRHI